MTSLVDMTSALQDRRFTEFAEQIRCARTVNRLDGLRSLIAEARGARRISREQYGELAAALDAKRVVLDALAPVPDPDSPHWHCGLPMRREIGAWSDPDINGNLIVDEQDVCRNPACSHRWPVVGDEWDRPEVRGRIEAVRAHHAEVSDHAGCKADQPCKATRTGLRYLQAVPS